MGALRGGAPSSLATIASAARATRVLAEMKVPDQPDRRFPHGGVGGPAGLDSPPLERVPQARRTHRKPGAQDENLHGAPQQERPTPTRRTD